MTESVGGGVKHRRLDDSWQDQGGVGQPYKIYFNTREKHACPTREDLDQESVVTAELYRCRPSARLNIPILVQPTEVNNEVPSEAEFDLAVWRLIAGRAGCTSGMRSEYLKGWNKESRQ